MSEKQKMRRVDVTIAVLSIALIACAVLLGYMLGRQSVAGDVGKQVEKDAPVEQVFEADGARVTYRGSMEPTQGNVMFNFALENNTGSTVLVSGENVVINGEYSVQVLGGSATPIAPGTTGSVSLTFGYSVQTPLQSVDDIHSISCDLVMHDDDSLSTVVGSVPLSVRL